MGADHTAKGILGELFERSPFFRPDKQGTPPIPYVWSMGTTDLVLVVGENATGKSLLRRIVCSWAREQGHEAIALSMAGRTTAGFERLVVYGHEGDESTGRNSAHTVTMGIKTCRERERKHIVFWDEPDLGLSDGWSAGVGVAIRDFALDMPDHTLAAFCVTHSKALVRQLLPARPHFVGMGPQCPASVEAWLDYEPAPLPIEQLDEQARATRSRIDKVMNKLNKDRGR